jgi:DNA recombination protein RmuC
LGPITYIAFLFIGIAIGATAMWLFYRGKGAAETRDSGVDQVDLARLQQKLTTFERDEQDLRDRLARSETRVLELQRELESTSLHKAQFEERASRIPGLEKQVQELLLAGRTLNEDFSRLREQTASFGIDAQVRIERLAQLESEKAQLTRKVDELVKSDSLLTARLAGLTAELEGERAQSAEKLRVLTEAREDLAKQFELLANRVLEEKAQTFSKQSEENLSALLEPLKSRIKDFQDKVEHVYVEDGKDRSALKEQIRGLVELNRNLSQDAQNLALALKGDRKAQGNWGEIILEDILERAGLVRGQHYDYQSGVKDDESQTHVIPDIVIRLPGQRNLVVDSKFTLPDYRLFVEATNDQDRSVALKRHLAAVRNHMKVLSQQNYQSLYGISSFDFVVMFVPLEPAFSIAVTNDADLFQDAWDQNVLLVSPSTLLFVVRTVAYLWRQEDLSKNAKAISARGAELYDKLSSFVAELQKVGDRLDQAQTSFYDAKRKFCEGPGNVIRQAELLRELGVKPSKALPPKWGDSAAVEDSAALIEKNSTT